MTRDESHTRSSCHAARPAANRPRKPPGIDALVQGLPRRAGDIGRNPPRNRRRLMPQNHPVRSACRKSVGRIGPRRRGAGVAAGRLAGRAESNASPPIAAMTPAAAMRRDASARTPSGPP
ncbi:hypothetical protein Y038_5333 [Burkholderia pseudomallei MSHR543]|nr:hypothetical protein X941_5722 [Burkholderia pseudomallei MSHR5569]KGU69996.1 hypothetical protein Y038_5333 [Burkholderia pseudomallei MSHR543]